MRIRRTIVGALAGLAMAAGTATPAQAVDVLVPLPGVPWTVDGSGNAEPLGDPGSSDAWTCGIGRSKLLRNHYDDFFGNIEIHAVTKACHLYNPTTRNFTLQNRTFLCERFAATNGQCLAGTEYSGAQVADPTSIHLQFRADGGNYLFEAQQCSVRLSQQHRDALEAGSELRCYAGTFAGAPGHRYNAWSFARVTLAGQAQIGMDPDRISMSPEEPVS